MGSVASDQYIKSLIKEVASYDEAVNKPLLEKACLFAKKAHEKQVRASGEPYYLHPLQVAKVLAEMKLDEASIVTAVLHDTVEDTDVSLDEIEKKFGQEVRSLVDGVTKLTKIEYQSEHARQAENFRKLLLAMSEDIRVLMVKLADRLHNMRTLQYVKSPQKRMRIAHETMEIYAPLAERIGMQKMKNELQDMAFSELHSEARESILSRLEYLRQEGNVLVEKIMEELRFTFGDAKIEVEVQGREKMPYSIWRKMERKNISFEQLSDIMAFRVLTNSIEDCYRVLGVVHAKYQMVPGSFKDFISTPKANGYQSLHTVLMGPEQRFIEIQIRTEEMHQIAEFGVASHWVYKQESDKAVYNIEGKQYKWIRELLYILEHASDPEEFLENTKLEMYYDQVFCFTPRGDLIALPRGATPVDFAYAVHSDVGHHCAGAKVNSRIVPLRTQLHNGDQVEIITSKTQVPSPAWEKFVATGKARSEIRRFVRAKKREEYIKLGRSIIEKVLKENGKKISDALLKPLLPHLAKKTVEDLYAATGEGLITGNDILKVLFPDRKVVKPRKNPLSILRMRKSVKPKTEAIPIKGLIPGMAVGFAECCNPIPGDKIVGVVTTGKGMTIHTSDCEILENFSSTPERLVDVSWGRESAEQDFSGRLKVVLAHESGSLGKLANIIAHDKGNISNLKIINRSADFFELLVDVDVKGAGHLNNIIASLRACESVHSAERHKQ